MAVTTPASPRSHMASFDALDMAAAQAYRLASRWGGGYVVLTQPEGGGFCICGAVQGRRDGLVAAGWLEVGLASSCDMTGNLMWDWLDGRVAEPAPLTPFQAKDPASSREVRVLTDFPENVQVLAAAQCRILRCQRAISDFRMNDLHKLLKEDDKQATLSPAYFSYLDRAVERDMVEVETARLDGAMAAAHGVLGYATAGRILASDYLHGRRAPLTEVDLTSTHRFGR